MKHTATEVQLKMAPAAYWIDVPGATVMSFQFQFRAGSRYVAQGHLRNSTPDGVWRQCGIQ